MKKYTISDIINLVLTGVIPIFMFTFQFVDFVSWRYCIDNVFVQIVKEFMVYNQLFIIYIIANSYILKYCKYHRLMLWSMLIMYTLCDFMVYIPYQIYNLCINSLFVLGFYGFTISIVKFINQIKRYERRIKSIRNSQGMR